MPQIDELLSAAVHLHRSGDLEQAWQAYQRVLQMDPTHGAALNGAGLLLRQSGRFEEAVECCRKAIAADSSEAAYYANLGEAHRGLGQLFEGLDCYREAARLAPDEFAVHYNRATLCAQAGMHDEAIAGYQRALELRPHAGAQHALGGEYQRQGRLAEAAACYRAALEIDPDNELAVCDLSNVLEGLGRADESLAVLRQAVARVPTFAMGHCNLGLALMGRGELAEARASFERAIHLDAEHAGYRYNLGTVSMLRGELDAAVAAFDRALAIKPDYAEAQFARGMAFLTKGDFTSGWAGYEARLRCPTNEIPVLPKPRWDGSPLAGRTLLVYCEQGLGDTLQFFRFVHQAIECGGHVVIAAQRVLVPLLAGSCKARVVPIGDPLPPYDVFVPLLSMPYTLGTRLDNLPCQVPYLTPEPARVEKWRQHLAAYQGFKVGIVWQGRPELRGDSTRSIPLAQFAPLADVPGVKLFSLQQGAGTEQLAALTKQGDKAAFEIIDLASQLDVDGMAYRDGAAAIRSLDLVISPDTSAAHLAGALAAPVWVALSTTADWRWMSARLDSPWYPTARLFRQSSPGDWPDVFQRMAGELAVLAQGK